jgi:hypothetical protein
LVRQPCQLGCGDLDLGAEAGSGIGGGVDFAVEIGSIEIVLARKIDQRVFSHGRLSGDIFFDTISHAWLIRFTKHRIGDRRIVRLNRKWLAAGVLEEGRKIETVEGMPQGAVISPLLANVYLPRRATDQDHGPPKYVSM